MWALCVMCVGRSNGPTRGEKRAKESREWFMDDTRQRKESFGGLAEGNRYEVQPGRN